MNKCFCYHVLANNLKDLFVRPQNNIYRGGSRGGVEGVATTPLRIFFLLFCLILRKVIIE